MRYQILKQLSKHINPTDWQKLSLWELPTEELQRLLRRFYKGKLLLPKI